MSESQTRRSAATRGEPARTDDAVARLEGDLGAKVVEEYDAQPKLTLPGRATRVSLTLPESLTFDEWERVGRFLGRVSQSMGWLIGDWWHYGEHRYGERAAQALDSEVFAFQTFANAGWVAGKIEPARRREGVSFSKHSEVAALDPADQDRLLARVESEDLTTSDLREAVRQVKRQRKGLPELPVTGGSDPAPPEQPKQPSLALVEDTRSESVPAERDALDVQSTELEASVCPTCGCPPCEEEGEQ